MLLPTKVVPPRFAEHAAAVPNQPGLTHSRCVHDEEISLAAALAQQDIILTEELRTTPGQNFSSPLFDEVLTMTRSICTNDIMMKISFCPRAVLSPNALLPISERFNPLC